MFNHIRILLFSLLFCTVGSFAQEETTSEAQPTAASNPYLTILPGFRIADDWSKEFANHQFFNGKELVSIEGRLYHHEIQPEEGSTRTTSQLQIARNYEAAIQKLGGTILFNGKWDHFEDTRAGSLIITALAKKGTKEIWIEVFPCDNYYYLAIVEREAMKQEIDATAMLKAIESEGSISLQILFDTGKATIKSESMPIINQIVAMMKAAPALTISIEGHTDNTGTPNGNRELSEARAKSVYEAVVAGGIDRKRLLTVGWGQEKPVADNATEAGRAANRRVVLVKK